VQASNAEAHKRYSQEERASSLPGVDGICKSMRSLAGVERQVGRSSHTSATTHAIGARVDPYLPFMHTPDFIQARSKPLRHGYLN
jgi:hypothetical protein